MDSKVRKLKRKLCRPEPVRRYVRLLLLLLVPAAYAAVILCRKRFFETPQGVNIWFYTVFCGVFLLAAFMYINIRRAVRIRALGRMGRMSWDYLEKNGLAAQAAEEYFGKERVEGTYLHKGMGFNAFYYRKNIVTPNFSFIMSDGVVLHHSELVSTGRQRISGVSSEEGHSINRVEVFVLGVEDGTMIPLLSYRSKAKDEMVSTEKNDISYIRPALQDKLNAINSMIKTANPKCRTSLALVNATVISG